MRKRGPVLWILVLQRSAAEGLVHVGMSKWEGKTDTTCAVKLISKTLSGCWGYCGMVATQEHRLTTPLLTHSVSSSLPTHLLPHSPAPHSLNTPLVKCLTQSLSCRTVVVTASCYSQGQEEMFFSNVGKSIQDFTVSRLDCRPNETERENELWNHWGNFYMLGFRKFGTKDPPFWHQKSW